LASGICANQTDAERAKTWWQVAQYSPLLGRLFLTPLDRAMEDLCRKNWIRYQRFMDDYVIFAKTRNQLKGAIMRVSAVPDTMQLAFHPDKRYIGKTEKGFDFLGYLFKPP